MADSWQTPEPLHEPSPARSAEPAAEGLSRLGRLVRKELLEILRDRRTILTLILMPVLLYPLLTLAFQQFFLASRLTHDRPSEYRIGLPEDTTPQLRDALHELLSKGDEQFRRKGR